MEAQYKLWDGRLIFKVDGENPKAIFRALAGVSDVFGSISECGLCHGKDIRLRHRIVDDNSFFEAACGNSACRAKLEFGQTKKGDGLFPRRKDETGAYLQNGGWKIWVPTNKIQ